MCVSSELLIHTSNSAYRVVLGEQIVNTKAHQEGSVIWLVDDKVAHLHPDIRPAIYIAQEVLESKKNLETVAHIIESLRNLGCTRQSRLMALGGGIIQDLATFAASSYMRGIQWVYCPTTLLSMVDSCIGGKSSINVGRFKNIAGNFYPPQEIYIDVGFCETLTPEQIIEGLCEAAKICYVDSEQSFATYLSLVGSESAALKNDQLLKLIQHSLCVKKRFIEADEFDQGIRLLLNFGHTFGHALEGASGFAIHHGIAVGLGMLAAEYCSIQLGYSRENITNVRSLAGHLRTLLKGLPNLRETLNDLQPADALEFFCSDKKHMSDSFTLILFDQQGRPQRVHVLRTQEVRSVVLNTFQYLKEIFHEIQ